MLASYPISTLLPGVNINATVLSHGNSLDFGVLGDMHALPDLDIVVDHMLQRFTELERAVLGNKPRKAATATAATKSRKKTAARKKVATKRRTKTVARPKSAAKAKTTTKRRTG
jgi:hypothetical protein